MNVLIVVAHPRVQSLTFAVADQFTNGLQDAGHNTEVLDLWNNGFAYGTRKLPHRQVLWIGLAADSKEGMAKRQYDKLMDLQLNVAIAGYCGIANSKVEILHNTLDADPGTRERLLTQAYELGLHFSSMDRPLG